MSPRDDCVSKLCDLGCQYINIHIDNKGVNPINDLYLIFQYLKIFNKVRPNLILAFLQKLADEKAAAVKSNTAYQSKLVKDKLIENLSHPPIQLWVAGSSRGWKCKKGYIKRGNRCINEEEFQEAFEANIRLFVDGPDGYIIQGGVCKGVGCPN